MQSLLVSLIENGANASFVAMLNCKLSLSGSLADTVYTGCLTFIVLADKLILPVKKTICYVKQVSDSKIIDVFGLKGGKKRCIKVSDVIVLHEKF